MSNSNVDPLDFFQPISIESAGILPTATATSGNPTLPHHPSANGLSGVSGVKAISPSTPRRLIRPNVRKLFIPDPGYAIFDADLAGADAQVVAWEAEDEDLKKAFRDGLDVHSKNAEDMWGTAFTQLPMGSDARHKKRQQNKVAVHLTNYGGTARTLAITQGWTIAEAERFQRRWFALHPGIERRFHGGVRCNLRESRTVINRYQFPRVFFDRIDSCFGEALAWIPQSTVAITTYLGAFALEEKFPQVEILLQVHDSLVFQIPLDREPPPKAIKEALRVITPYPDPLTIPWGLARSEKSWGEVSKVGGEP